jgi:signal transduction histidine kinase
VARVPLTRGEDVIGLLILVSRRGRVMRDPFVLDAIGDQLSAALEHAALYEAAYRRERDLEDLDHRRREFIAAISHEIRTPLTSIQAFADLLALDQDSMDPDAESLITSLTLGVERLNRLVGDLIDLGRAGREAQEVHATEMDIVELLRSAEQVLRPSFLLRQQTLSVDAPEHPLLGIVDQRLLEQVVLSLLSNANRHAPSGGVVTLRAAATEEGHIRVSVEDSGPGIAPEERDRIFEPYYRVERADGTSVPGSGLGLAVARQLMDQQGGRIWVEPAAGGGACFIVEFRASMERDG